MAFVLPANPNDFGTQLARTLSQVGADIGTGIMEGRTNRKDQEILNSINEQSSPIDIVKAHARLSAKRQASAGTLLDQYLKQQNLYKANEQKLENQKLLDQQRFEQKQQFEEEKRIAAEKKAGAQRQRSISEANKGVEQIEKLIGEKGIGFFSHYTSPGNEAFENSAKLNTATAPMYKFFKEELFPGRFTDADLKFVNNTFIPKPGDREATIKGKLTAFKELVNGMKDGEITPDQIQQTASQLTPDEANSIYDEAKGNVQEAERIARERGYQW